MDQITQAFQSFSRKNKLIVLGDFNPLITNDAIWRHPTLTQLPEEFPI